MQAAYEVLSDPQERAWYDSHCDASLVQGIHRQSTEHYEHDVRVTTAEDISRIILGFSGRPDYSDTEGGFYSTLRRCFDTLAKEEELACEWENLESVSYPSFGSAEDSHEGAVRPFYIVWTNFSTKKTFSWMDVYRYSEAPDRRTRRMMEKDNKRFRDEGIREFNETVRSFVAFIKKRDPRYIPNTQSEANRQKVLRDAAKAQAARSRAANLAKINEQVIPEWVKTEMPGGSKISEEETEDLRQQYECIVCKKTFKSENQYEVHENSKKHIKAVQHLRKIMQLEDVTLGLDNANIKHQDSSIVHPQATAGFMDDFQLLDDSTLSINELSITDTAELSLTKGEFGNEETNSESYDNYLVENEDSSTSIRSCPPSPCGNVTNFQPKIGKAKKKRMKKAARNEKGVTMSSQEVSALMAFGKCLCLQISVSVRYLPS